jgi:hypothetical protein
MGSQTKIEEKHGTDVNCFWNPSRIMFTGSFWSFIKSSTFSCKCDCVRANKQTNAAWQNTNDEVGLFDTTLVGCWLRHLTGGVARSAMGLRDSVDRRFAFHCNHFVTTGSTIPRLSIPFGQRRTPVSVLGKIPRRVGEELRPSVRLLGRVQGFHLHFCPLATHPPLYQSNHGSSRYSQKI